MATEEFKELTQQLFSNYVELMSGVKEKGFEVKLSFKEYLDFYIRYVENEDVPYGDDEEDDDLEELDDSPE